MSSERGSERPPPKFEVGQIVMMTNLKKPRPFKVVDRMWNHRFGGWWYAWNRKNYAAETMLRAQTKAEEAAAREAVRGETKK